MDKSIERKIVQMPKLLLLKVKQSPECHIYYMVEQNTPDVTSN